MGHQIYAGNESVCFTDGAWLVVNWCERFAPKVKPEGMSDWGWADMQAGSTDISASAVKVADERVPHEFAEAKSMGLLDGHYRREFDEDAFRQCREFLRYAAANNLDISGSY